MKIMSQLTALTFVSLLAGQAHALTLKGPYHQFSVKVTQEDAYKPGGKWKISMGFHGSGGILSTIVEICDANEVRQRAAELQEQARRLSGERYVEVSGKSFGITGCGGSVITGRAYQ